MSEYLDLYNLEITTNPYSARFIAKAEEDLPADCVLPPDAPYNPIPPFDLQLPDLACKFNIDTPVIPPPYFCSPHIDGGIGLTVLQQNGDGICLPTDDITVTEDTGIRRKPGTECDFELFGGFEICLPCIPTFGGSVTITACSIDGHNELNIETNEPINLHYDPTTCSYELRGDIAMCVPCIPEPSYESVVNQLSSGDYISAIDFRLTKSGDHCEPTIRGELDLSFSKLPCSIDTVSAGEVFASNTVPNQDQPSASFSFGCVRQECTDDSDPSTCCCKEEQLSGSISIAACSKVTIKKSDTISLSFPLVWSDVDESAGSPHTVGGITLTLYIEAADDDDPCTKKLNIVPDNVKGHIKLPSTQISLCNGDGSTTNLCVLTSPTPETDCSD